MTRSQDADFANVFELPDFRRLLFAIACTTLASRALAVVIGYQVYAITKSPFALGYLGLVEAIPALGLALYGGHIADRYDRRSILRITLGALVASAVAIAGVAAMSTGGLSLAALYVVVFFAGIARGFAEPAIYAWEAQIIPPALMMKAAAWFSSTWLCCAIAGPVLGGASLAVLGPALTFGSFATLFAFAWVSVTRMRTYPVIPPLSANRSGKASPKE